MNATWQEFVKQAQEIYPAFSNEQVIKAVLKSRGEKTFKPEYVDKFIKDLRYMVDGWQTFLKDAKEIDKEFGDDRTVARILNSHGIPWYGEFDVTEGLKVLTDWRDAKEKANKPWDYPCPICGSPTVRDGKYDYMYRRECNGLGWKCTQGGYSHFHAAAWAHLKPKMCNYKPEVDEQYRLLLEQSAKKELADVNV